MGEPIKEKKKKKSKDKTLGDIQVQLVFPRVLNSFKQFCGSGFGSVCLFLPSGSGSIIIGTDPGPSIIKQN
jgi:hypothetical protein